MMGTTGAALMRRTSLSVNRNCTTAASKPNHCRQVGPNHKAGFNSCSLVTSKRWLRGSQPRLKCNFPPASVCTADCPSKETVADTGVESESETTDPVKVIGA